MTLDNTWGPLPSTMIYWTGVPNHWEPLEALETAQYYTKMELLFVWKTPLPMLGLDFEMAIDNT